MVVDHVRQFLEQQVQSIEYYQWIKQYIPIAVLAHWLDDYVNSILTANDARYRFNIRFLFNPSMNPALRGTGVQAPPLTPVLRVGGHFVLRELVRHGIVTRQEAIRECFVPVRRVRGLLQRLGCPDLDGPAANRSDQSHAIHAFLARHLDGEDVSFGGAFDIPLMRVAENRDLWWNFLHEELPPLTPDDEEDYYVWRSRLVTLHATRGGVLAR
jgi:hypothetical protein